MREREHYHSARLSLGLNLSTKSIVQEPTFNFHCQQLLFQGIARTQSPLRKNYALESPAFGVIAAVNPTSVQWKGLGLNRLPS